MNNTLLHFAEALEFRAKCSETLQATKRRVVGANDDANGTVNIRSALLAPSANTPIASTPNLI